MHRVRGRGGGGRKPTGNASIASAACAACVALTALLAPAARAQSVEDLQRLSLEDLTNISVTSVSRRPEPLSDAAAAIYVITAEDIRRSGAVRLAEVLRLAPNLEVQQLNGQTYAISARGFDSVIDANKLLVMIDGRSIYSPIHSETFWIRSRCRSTTSSGSRSSAARVARTGAQRGQRRDQYHHQGLRNSQGVLLNLKLGTIDQNGLLQYGGKFGTNGTYRVYGQGLGEGPTVLKSTGGSAGDAWHGGQTGFRTDWRGVDDTVLAEGDFYRNNDALLNGRQYGGDLTARWDHRLDGGSNVEVQTSYDEQHRYELGGSDYYASYDLQAQHTLTLGRNLFVYGAEFQSISDKLVETTSVGQFVPQSRWIGIGDAFRRTPSV